MEDDLVASGRFVRIETRGEQSGLARAVTVGFVEDEGSRARCSSRRARRRRPGRATCWPIRACRVLLGERAFAAVAEPLGRADHAARSAS